jgi:hypothetical protein
MEPLKDIWQTIIYPAIFWVLFASLVVLGLLVYFGVIAPGLWAMIDPSPAEYLKAKEWSLDGALCGGVFGA